jgi:glycosyltransferase involved in cell wall biosynthesis/SAM-dependent methyltransferase
VVPGPLDQRTGGYLYDARMVRELRARGWQVEVHEVEGAFPPAVAPALNPALNPTPALNPAPEEEPAVRHLGAVLEALPEGALVLLDGLAMGGMPDPGPLSRHARRLRLVSLVHHPLFLETGLSPEKRELLWIREAAALTHCRGVITTSAHTAREVEALGVPAPRVRVAPPGTDPAPLSRGPDPGAPPVLLSVASVVPRKGQDVLVEALARLRDRRPGPWVARLVGSLERAPDFARTVEARIRNQGLEERVHLVGEVSDAELEAHYDGASVFVLASHHEGFGMVLTEALARGLPVVATTGGAIPDTLPGGAARLVTPGDAEALAEALDETLDEALDEVLNEALNEALDEAMNDASMASAEGQVAAGTSAKEAARETAREAARRRAASLPDWTEAAAVLATGLRELATLGVRPAHATFPPTWLALREPADHGSRAAELLGPLRTWMRRQGEGGGHVVDLGSGTGSNLRFLAPRLATAGAEAGPFPWVLVDHDPTLLAQARSLAEAAEAAEADPSEASAGGEPTRPFPRVETVVGDLAAEGLEAVAGARLVTASALLDLVSEAWIDRLVGACRAHGAAAYFALSYDGRVRWEPSHPLDAEVLAAVNAHQHRDKGLGGALGPDATEVAARRFREAGFQVVRAASPWVLGPGDGPLVRPLVEGWVAAAVEARPDRESGFRAWGRDRLALLQGGGPFTLEVGHEDLLALPPKPADAGALANGGAA